LKKLFVSAFLLFFLSPFFYSCGNGEEEGKDDGMDTTFMNDGGAKPNKVQNIFYAIPSPIEIAQLIQKAGASYNKDLLNNPNDAGKYMSNTSKALNLGIYGADLSYTSVFDDNTHESILFLTATRKLAEQLGVGNAFDEKTVDRVQANTGRKDSLLNIISDSYMTTDEMLKESQRESASALVIAGGFIEALYLGTQLAKTAKDPKEIINRIAEQKGTMDNVVGLLSTYEQDAGVASILPDIKALKEIYDQVKVETQSASEVKTNPSTKVTTIGGKITYIISPETVELLTKKSSEIRNKIITSTN
jgi:hypothetical protein